MFVGIDNRDMNIPNIDEWIKRVRNANGGVISPEFAMEILGKTNHKGHLKPVLNNIRNRCKTKEDLKPYGEFILACVDRRETGNENLKTLQEMADLCGCRDKLDLLNRKKKFYEIYDCVDCISAVCRDDVNLYEGGMAKVFVQSDNFNYDEEYEEDVPIKDFIFMEEEEFYINNINNMPKDLDVSMYSKLKFFNCDFSGCEEIKLKEGGNINLSGSCGFSEVLDLSMCDKVDLSYADLSGVKEIKFKEGAEVDLSRAQNLPEVLDLSMCSKVDLYDNDLSDVKEIKFREGAKVVLDSATNLPKDLDVSMCSRVDLNACDLRGLNLKFREGAEVSLYNSRNLPKDLDVSMCSEVDLHGCDLRGLNLKFREGAEVDLGYAYNLPEVLDLSMCSKVYLYDNDLSDVKEIKFREGAVVDFRDAKNLPKDLDFSQCSKVDLSGCDLSGLSLKFREGSEVCLFNLEKLPEYLDISKCESVEMFDCGFLDKFTIKFKNREQEKELIPESDLMQYVAIYEEDDNKSNHNVTSSLIKNVGIDM